VGILTILVLLLWKAVAPGRLALIPAPLVAVLAGTAAATLLALPVLSVEVPASIVEEIHVPTWTVLTDAPWSALFGTAVLFAAVASAESLLCATAVDQLHSGARTKYDRELVAQGVGNTVCGVLGALPMTGVIVRSSANVQAGGRTRLSAILHGLWLLVFVALFASALRAVPTACLAAILVYTGFKLVNWQAVVKLREHGWSEVGIYAITVTVIVVEDLLVGVLVGVALSAVKLLYVFSHLATTLEVDADENRATLRLNGSATFIRLPRFAEALEQVPRGSELHIDVEGLNYIDHACLELLSNWSRQHEKTGGSTTIDWNRLAATARSVNGNGNGNGSLEEAKKEAARVA
jgi:MFS superfamily sulfate permease-like transporter